MKILVTSLHDLRRTSLNRLHQFLRLLSVNHDITVLCTNYAGIATPKELDQYEQFYNDEHFKAMFQKINILYITNEMTAPVLQQVSIKSINKALQKVDLNSFDVHLNYQSLIPGYLVARNTKKLGIPTVFDIADDLLERNKNTPNVALPLRPLVAMVGPLMLKRNIKIARKVTYITRAMAEVYHIPQQKSALIPNGVDTELFRDYPSQELRKELGIQANDFVVGFVGVTHWWVDFEPVLAALAQLDKEHHNMRLILISGGGEFQQIQDMAQRYGVRDKVTFLQLVPHSRVPRYISCMDVCLAPLKPSRDCRISLPMKLFEYMACSKPVICTKLEGVKEAFGDKVLYASNAEEYESSLTDLYNNEQLRRKLSSEGRLFIEENYSWLKSTTQLERVLQETVASK